MKVNHLRLKARDFLPFPEWDIKLNKVIGMKSPRGKPCGIIRFGYFFLLAASCGELDPAEI